MPAAVLPTTFDDAMDWIAARAGNYTMRLEKSRIVISVRVGDRSASEIAATTDESDLEVALLRAIGRIVDVAS